LEKQQETSLTTAASKYIAIQVATLKPSDIRKFFDIDVEMGEINTCFKKWFRIQTLPLASNKGLMSFPLNSQF